MTKDQVKVDLVTDEEVANGVKLALAKVGKSYDELESEAKSGHFSSPLAMRTWATVHAVAGARRAN
jgi:hypothetical protein